jgi:hypothetical protein
MYLCLRKLVQADCFLRTGLALILKVSLISSATSFEEVDLSSDLSAS